MFFIKLCIFYRKKKRFERRNIKKILENEIYDILIDFQSLLPFESLSNKVIDWQHLSLGKIKNREKFKEFLKKLEKE